MADTADLYDQPFNPLEVWDPRLRTNVYLNNGMSASEYIQQNAGNYAGYTGAVAHMGGTPIHASTFTGQREPDQKAQYRQDYERSRVNPYDTQPFAQSVGQVAQTAQVAPGTRPDLGFTPGLGGLNLMNFTPLDWSDVNGNNGTQPDEVERRLLQMASERQLNFPTLKSLTWDKGHNPAEGFTTRGYEYGGQASPEEAQLTQDFLGGRSTNINRMAALRGNRVQQVPLSGLQQFGNKVYAPLLVAGVGAMMGPAGAALGPAGGAALGAGFGALAGGGMSRWENPGAVLAGAAGGALGGYGAGFGAQALGAGPILTGAASGVGGGLGSAAGRGAAGGGFDPANVLQNAAIGGFAGSAGAATGVPASAFSGPANVSASVLSPRRRNPYQ